MRENEIKEKMEDMKEYGMWKDMEKLGKIVKIGEM